MISYNTVNPRFPLFLSQIFSRSLHGHLRRLLLLTTFSVSTWPKNWKPCFCTRPLNLTSQHCVHTLWSSHVKLLAVSCACRGLSFLLCTNYSFCLECAFFPPYPQHPNCPPEELLITLKDTVSVSPLQGYFPDSLTLVLCPLFCS